MYYIPQIGGILYTIKDLVVVGKASEGAAMRDATQVVAASGAILGMQPSGHIHNEI
jgi:hypothetical protein